MSRWIVEHFRFIVTFKHKVIRFETHNAKTWCVLSHSRALPDCICDSRVKSAQIVVCSWNISSNTVPHLSSDNLEKCDMQPFQLCVWRRYTGSLNLPLPTTAKGSAASLGGSYADERGRTGFLLSRGGLCRDVLSALHLSHSGLSCLSTPSPV